MPAPTTPDPAASPDGPATGETGAPDGSGWHPDPTGRHAHRWWDGTAWTAHVSSGGAVAEDALEPSTALLEATALAFDLGEAGVRGEGTWIAWDRATETRVGSIEASWGSGFVVHVSYVVRDVAGRVLATLDRTPQIGLPGLVGRDHLGRPSGRAEVRGEAFTLLAPQSDEPGAPEVAWATGRASGLRYVSQGRALEGPLVAELTAHDGSPAGRVHVDEPPPPHPYRSGGGPTWAHLQRPEGLPPALQVLGVVAVPVLAFMAMERRDLQSRRSRGRDL